MTAITQDSQTLYNHYQQTKDPRSFGELLSRWQRQAHSVALGICCDRELAQEAVQEAFLMIASGKAVYEDRGRSHRVWFMGLVAHRALMAARTERRARIRSRINPRAYVENRTLSHQLDARVEDMEWSARLRQTLNALEERLRIPVLLHFFQGMRQKEVAAVLGVSQQNVSARIARGLAMLRLNLT